MRDSALCHAGTEGRLHLAPVRAGVSWLACLAGLAGVRARALAYEGTPHRLAAG